MKSNKTPVEMLREMRGWFEAGSPEAEALTVAIRSVSRGEKERAGIIDKIADKVVEKIAEKLLKEAEK